MKRIAFPLLISAALFTFIRCEDEQPVPRTYPRVTDMAVTNVSEGGATFMADLYSAGTEALVEHGFVWGKWSGSKDLRNYDRVYLGVPQTGKFQAEVRATFKKDETYFVRPFIQTRDRVVYGPEVSFVSLGSEGPVITRFEPQSGAWNDTLRIFGRNFSWVQNEVTLNDVICGQVKSTDTSIVALISQDVITIDNNVSVSINGNKFTYSVKKFTLVPPSISDYYPKQAFWGDAITIKGSIVKFYNYSSSVTLGSVKCGLFNINLADSTAKILVSADVNTQNNNLKVTIGKYIITATDPFTLLPPHFTISPIDGTWRSVVTLKGRFNPKSTANLIKVGGYNATISSFNSDSIKIAIPNYLVNHKNAVSLSSPPFTIVATDSFRLAKPVITSISPVSGSGNTAVIVKGRYISNIYVYNFTKVKFGDFSVSSTFINDSTLYFNVPYNVPNGTYKITVIAGNQVAESEESFTVRNPIITDFSPKTGTFGDVITIYGENFPSESGVMVNICSDHNRPISITPSAIRVEVPNFIYDTIPGNISISFSSGTVVANQFFTLSPPVITSITPGTINSAGQDIIINGNGFNPINLNTNVYWDIYPLAIKAGSSTQITATLPAIMSGNDARVRIKVAGYTRFSNILTTNIISKWNKSGNYPNYIPWDMYYNDEYNRNISFSIYGRGYILDHRTGSTKSFDPVTNALENLGTNSSLAYKFGLAGVVCNDTAYLMGDGVALHRFDIETKQWISTGVHSPVTPAISGIFFSLNGKIYYGLPSVSYYNPNINRTLWEFDKKLGSWKQKSSLPDVTAYYSVAYFSMNDKGYVLFANNKFCEYDPVSDSWAVLQDYPADINFIGRSVMVIGDKVYVGLGRYNNNVSDKIHVYDRSTDSWALSSRIPYGGRSHASTFVINNKGYVFSGVTNYVRLYEDMLEFDPSIE